MIRDFKNKIFRLKRWIHIKRCVKRVRRCCNLSLANDVDFNVKIVHISDRDNHIEVHNGVMLESCEFNIIGQNNTILIEEDCKLNNVVFWIEGNDNRILIGKGTKITGKTQLAACDGTQIEIGERCLFSHDIFVRTTDSHKISKNGQIINKSASIKIGNHVWVGMQALILKGSTIAAGCVIGARSTITHKTIFSENSIIVGQPAKLASEDIRWEE